MLVSMLDTNICVRALRDGEPHVLERLRATTDELCISTIILHELYVGAELSARIQYQYELADKLAANLTVLDFDVSAARHAANVRADLTRRGQLIGANDILIAGHARSQGLTLITGNLREFRRVDGLRCEDWLAQEEQER